MEIKKPEYISVPYLEYQNLLSIVTALEGMVQADPQYQPFLFVRYKADAQIELIKYHSFRLERQELIARHTAEMEQRKLEQARQDEETGDPAKPDPDA